MDIDHKIDCLRWARRIKYIMDEHVLHNATADQVSYLYDELEDLRAEILGTGNYVPSHMENTHD